MQNAQQVTHFGWQKNIIAALLQMCFSQVKKASSLSVARLSRFRQIIMSKPRD
jgi:hypothetical protein